MLVNLHGRLETEKNLVSILVVRAKLIVVVIIGILSSALLPRLQGAQSAARDSARKSDLSQLGSAILQYYNNRGEYPEGTGGTTEGSSAANTGNAGSGTAFSVLDPDIKVYMYKRTA